MEFRPCIDIHNGAVKQIVGGALNEEEKSVKENFVSGADAAYYARLYKEHGLFGGHVIMLNKSGTPEYEASKAQALGALEEFPKGMHIGGGITPENAPEFIDAGASHVIVTSYVFKNGIIDMDALNRLEGAVGKERVVLDLSVRKRDDRYMIVTDRWQVFTSTELTRDTLDMLSDHCDEFLVHGVDVEGLSSGIESELVGILGSWNGRPVTYAGGVHGISDIELISVLGAGKVNVTVGSALDIFGGSLKMSEVIDFCENMKLFP